MKKIILYILLITFQICSAQVTSINLKWSTGDYSLTEDITVNIPHFDPDYFSYDDVNNKISFSTKIESQFTVNEKNCTINNVIFEDIASDKLGVLDKTIIPTELNAVFTNSTAREVNYVLISFSPIIKEGNIYKKVVSFSYSLEANTNKLASQRNVNAITNSVLKTGNWKKFAITKSGVYVIRKSFLTSLGFDVNVDPRTVKIFGNGGRMIPLNNSVPYPFDLAENAIQFEGENDGVFNDNDFILFYAEGVDVLNIESDTNINLYADKTYYYITSAGANGKRISQMPESTQPTDLTFTTFDNYLYYERDLINIGRFGRKWYGEQFKITNEQNFEFSIPNADISQQATIKVVVAGAAISTTSMSVKANNTLLGNLSFAKAIGFLVADEKTQNSNISLTNNNILVSLNYNNNGIPSGNCFLDQITIKAKSFLTGYGKQFKFKVNAASTSIGTGEYVISNASNISQIWDITDIYNVATKINSNQNLINLKTFLGQTQNFIAVDKNDVYNPINDGNTFVANQDIKGSVFLNKQGVFTDVDYIIVTPASLNSQAEKLANFHRTNSNLNVKVYNLEGIYQEFSSGKQDIGAIRNLVKYVYDNASAPSKRIKYLCLFGDTSFDYKNRIPNNNNIVPTFHAINSLSDVSAFMSDDFYGLMDANEGDMTSALGIDVAVGRIIVSNPLQAEQMVTKVIDYHDKKSYGRWRNNLVFLSDDIDNATDKDIQTDLNALSDAITNAKPFLNSKKIHIDSYVQETTSGGQKYPKAKEDFINAFDQGALVFNYFGHGGEDGLSAERLFERKDAINLKNRYRYPLFITVTCEFTRFDNPYRPTAGEQTYLNPSGGAVSMVTTTRLIYQIVGQVFNINLASNLFAYGSSNYPSIAEAVRKTKAGMANSGNNVIFYIGDPALKLAIPKPKIVLTKINGTPVTNTTPNLEALSFATLTGEVTDEFNNTLTNYNGELAVNIFDKEINRTTLGNDGTLIGGVLSIMPFKTLGETIFRGNVSVTNGKFEFGFVVPRDIKIPIGTGKASFYAKNNALPEDQTGSDFNIKIGGLNVNAVADVTPPLIKLYMNDETFVSGGITNETPLFLAFLEDENGINTASGIGHDIVAILDGDETKPYILNDFYETELNNYKKGKLKFPFTKLKPGIHTLTFKAWDVYNNIITSELQFVVVGNETLTLTNVLNYPNPFVNYTEFWFTHNKPFEELDVQIQIYTITGKIVWTKNQIIYNNGFTSRDITWNGRDDFGDKIGKGVYVYKLTVKSNISDKKIEKIEKLVIL